MKFFLQILFILFFLTSCNSTNDNNYNIYADGNKYSVSIFAMDTDMTLTAYGENAVVGLEKSIEKIRYFDELWANTNSKSEIYNLNENKTLDVSKDTLDIITKSIEISEISNQSFDITIYPIIKLWGFIDKKYNLPTSAEIESQLPLVNYENIKIEGNKITLENSAEITLGAIAKGYTSNVIMDIFKESGVTSAVVSLGGNVQTIGKRPDGNPWNVALQDPLLDSSYLGIVHIENKAVITSGKTERFFEIENKSYHHILDPKSGYPAENSIISITIIADDGAIADGFSTALFVMGKEKAIEFWKNSDYSFDMIILTDEENIYITEGAKDCFTLSDENRNLIVTEK